MKRGATVLLSIVALTAATSALAAEEGRFDAQVFRPLAAPRDLVMVPKSEVIGHLSPVVGVYWDAALDPLALAIGDTGKTLHAVGARLQITPLVGIGLFDWVEFTMAIPFVAWQMSDDLRSIGTEGSIKSTPTLGDIRVSTKVAMPFLNRRDEVKSGFGLALGGNINLPTGDELAFTSDGAISGGVSVIADYRFNFGLILASNLGVWIRPEHAFAGAKIGDMAQLGVAAEMYVVRRWGLSVIGELYGFASLTGFPDDAAQVPAEALLGVRWQTRQGVTFTVGGSFGAACGFGAPALRLFNSVIWQPKSSREQQEINRVLERDGTDPDHDGVHESVDKCPTAAGPPQNHGCPDHDRDGDGARDPEDQCPERAAGPDGKNGCPLARVEGDAIVTLEPLTFDPDSGDLSSRSKTILEAVIRVMRDTPTIRWVDVEVHTDLRDGEAEAYEYSEELATDIAEWIINAGIPEDRIHSQGFGHTQPVADDSGCLVPDEELSPECIEAMNRNARILFRIKRWGAPASREILGNLQASVLPMALEGEAPRSLPFPSCRPWTKKSEKPIPCILPMKPAVLTPGGVLSNAKDAEGRLPNGKAQSLPSGGVLLKGGSVLPTEGGTSPSSPQ